MPIISKKICNILIAFLLAFFPAVSFSYAAEVTIFGPQKFIRTKGAPDVYTGNFTGLFTDDLPGGKLIVLNGNQTGENRIEDAISSAEFYLNGELVFSESDFNKNVYLLEANVPLVESNSFYIELKSSPGSYLTIRFIQDIPSPSTNITAVPDAIKVDEDSLLTWTSSLANDCFIEPEIGAVDCNSSIMVSPDITTIYTFMAAGPGGTVTSSETITHINSLPLAHGQSIDTNEDATVSIQLTASDVDNDSFTYNVITNPAYGALSGETPNLTYSPEPNYYGTDYFTFAVNDGVVDSNTAIVQINIIPINDPPIADAGADQAVFKGDMVYLDGSQSSDIDGDALSFQWAFVSMPGESSASLSDSTSRTPSFIADKSGTYEIMLVVNDGSSDSLPDSVIINAETMIVEVPDVKGMLQSEAEAAIMESDLIAGDITTAYDEDIPEDHVISQYPDPGTLIETGSSVDLVISLGPDTLIGDGEISGTVIDALTGSVLPGAEITLFMEQEDETLTVISQYTALEDGSYVFSGLPSGDYVIEVVLEGYITEEDRLTLMSDDKSVNRDIILSPLMAAGEVRIVLTWGESPEDLESHLTAPNTEGCRYHCFYDTREIPGANLDLDDMTSYGPETITVTSFSSGTYRYYVHDFTNRTSTTSDALSLSGTRVKIYFGSGAEPVEFAVPDEAGTVWHVFDLDGESQQITPVNIMGFQEQPGEIDFPVITSSPDKRANIGEAYSYQVTAEDPDDDILIYSLEEYTDGMTIDPLTGEIAWTPGDGQVGYHEVEVKVSDGRCGEDEQRFQINATSLPIIRSFFSDPCLAYNQDGTITLTWSTERAETVSIDQGIGEVASSGSITISSPADPVVYTLTAENASGRIQASVPQNPGGTFKVTPSFLPETGGTATLTWNFPCAVICNIHGIGDVSTSGSLEVDVTEVPAIYIIMATNASGTKTLTALILEECTDPIVIELDSDAVCSWAPGEPINIKWDTISGCIDSCEIDQGIGEVASSGSIEVTPAETTTYTITCSGASGMGQKSITVPKILDVEIESFYASYASILPGQSIKLAWNTQCAETCTIDQGIGEVEPDGSITITPATLPVTYTLTATGKGETKTRSITIKPRVDATFEVLPSTLKIGESATLTWTTVNAYYCEITPGIGEVDLNGTLSVQPSGKTTYKLYAEGPSGSAVKYATVNYTIPTAQLLADREVIEEGESVTLSWVFSNALTCTINQDIGEVQEGESVIVTPEDTTTYTMTAEGPGGTATDSVTITVLHPPSITVVQPDGIYDAANKFYTIMWKDEDADSDAIISLYYDTDNSGKDGFLIASDIHEDTDPTNGEYDRYIWDISEMDEGEYYIYAVIDDGYHDPVTDCSDGTVTIDHSISAFKITASDGQEYDYFGGSVAMDQGYVIVGAYGDDNGDYYNSGAAYIYKQEGESWKEQVKLTADDAQDSDIFGRSVSISGDYAAVGAEYAETPAGSYAGAVYIFKNDGESWIQQARITADDGAHDQYFGAAVCISGDILIVGAPGDSEYDECNGTAYIYKRNGSDWIVQSKIYPSNPCYLGCFGTSVGIKGDNTVIVGSSRYSAYIFEYNGSEWIEQSILSSGDNSSYFGSSVSIDGDYIVVGDQGYDSTLYGLSNSGAAFIFGLSDSIWVETDVLEPEDLEATDRFGCSVYIKGNYIIAGATGDDYGDSNAGAAYIYNGEADENGTITSWAAKSKLLAPDPETNDSFGSSVYLNDGYAIIGSTGDDDNGSSSGSAYIYPLYLTVRGGADPEIIEKSDSTVLSWTSVLADSCVIEPDIGTVSANGSIVVSPEETTTYVVTASGTDGIVSDSVTVTVVDPEVLPYAEIYASHSTIGYTDSTTITWNAANSISCTIEPGIGAVSNSGSVMVSPAEDTTYTIIANNSGGSTAASVTVNVICYNPIVTVDIAPDTIELGDSAVITWTGQYTDYCGIQPDVGQVDASGSVSLSPEDSITYVLTATGPCGESLYTIPITVNGPVSIEMTYPDGVNEYADQTCTVKWTDKGPNVDAVISLYYDTDDSGEDGTLIVSGINETPDGDVYDSYAWDTGSMQEGAYYVYAVIDDGVNTPVVDYSDAPVNILHSVNDGLKISVNNLVDYAMFGYSVAMSGDYAVVGDTADSAYIFKQDGSVWVQEARLIIKDEDGSVDSEKTLAIDGDFAIVGVENAYNSEGLSTGMGYIFQRESDVWSEQARFEVEDIEYFGCAVSISGDYAIIGARSGDYNIYPYDTGAAYVLKREGNTWIKQTKLIADDCESYDYFGYSVALSGDYAIIGARGDDNGGLSNSGSVYIFKREGDTWIQQAKLIPDDLTSNEYFGSMVAIDGDYAVVGSPYNDNSGYTNSGAVHIYIRDGETWIEQAKITDPEAGSSGQFGRSVGINSNRIIVGGDQKALIFQNDGTDWIQQKEIIPDTDTIAFGASVAISDDYALVGDCDDDDAGDASGAVYFYPLAFVEICAEPERILSGESTTLTWSSNFADSCTIEPDIGMADTDGSITVTPYETTTYTITATGYGITATDQVTVTVTYPLPTVSIGAEPAIINIGDSCLLTWNTIDADSCEIDNGIGEVDINGSITVTPSETTTYTITVTGPGGTATATVSVTVTYPVPTVTLNAEPQIIDGGGSSVLSWSSQYATQCFIEPDIGSVDIDGDVAVYPTETTIYTITATGPGGSIGAEITVIVNPTNVIISSPISGSTVHAPNVLVEGTILDQTGEVGVAVNGVVALVDGDYFTANHVPLEEGENTLTITVTDADENSTMSIITVYYEPSDSYLTVTVDEETGIAPFETTIKVRGTFTFEDEPVITYTGPADIEITDTENDNKYQIYITTPGLYFLIAEVEYESMIYSDTVAVLAMDLEVLDGLLKAKWNGMKTALIDGNIEHALTYYIESSKEQYREIFNALADSIPTIASDMREIELIYVYDKLAKYRIKKEESLSGQVFDITYFIYFVKGLDGIWKIESF